MRQPCDIAVTTTLQGESSHLASLKAPRPSEDAELQAPPPREDAAFEAPRPVEHAAAGSPARDSQATDWNSPRACSEPTRQQKPAREAAKLTAREQASLDAYPATTASPPTNS